MNSWNPPGISLLYESAKHLSDVYLAIAGNGHAYARPIVMASENIVAVAGTAHPTVDRRCSNLFRSVPVVGLTIPDRGDSRIQIVLKNILAETVARVTGRVRPFLRIFSVGILVRKESTGRHIPTVRSRNIRQPAVERQRPKLVRAPLGIHQIVDSMLQCLNADFRLAHCQD